MKKPTKQHNGYVYILKMIIGKDVVYKIGTTNRTPYTRMLEIVGELYGKIGYIPKTTILKEHRVLNNYEVEAQLLSKTAPNKYELPYDGVVCGESEMRVMCENEICQLFDKEITINYPAMECYEVEI